MSDSIKALYEFLSISIHNGMQDWDIECADAARIEEFCDAYENESLMIEQKAELMRLIIASCDDSLNYGQTNFDWERITYFLENDYEIHKETVEYWSLLDESDLNNTFKITSLIHEIREKITNK